jgi:hypothetical protein
MTEYYTRQAFDERCDAIAARVRSLGVTLAKSAPGAHELHVYGDGAAVVFPIVTDETDWDLMSPAEAFYGAMVDAKAWQNVRLDDETTSQLDELESIALPSIAREATAESLRLRKLAQMLGGRPALDDLLAQVDSP